MRELLPVAPDGRKARSPQHRWYEAKFANTAQIVGLGGPRPVRHGDVIDDLPRDADRFNAALSEDEGGLVPLPVVYDDPVEVDEDPVEFVDGDADEDDNNEG